MNLRNIDEVVNYMKQATSTEDWNYRCDRVKQVNGGGYPQDWFPRIILSGVMDATLGAGSSDIKVYRLTFED